MTDASFDHVTDWVFDLDNTLYDPAVRLFDQIETLMTHYVMQATGTTADQADQLRKQGGFIPGIRPGPQTERYLQKILSRITLPGALFLAAVALIPPVGLLVLLPDGTDQFAFAFAGTSILIAVGVSLETMKQIDSQLMMRNYEGFLD